MKLGVFVRGARIWDFRVLDLENRVLKSGWGLRCSVLNLFAF